MEYLNQKWKIWYKSLDVNHDGTISMADVEESRSKFTNLHHLLGDKAESVRADMEKWWNTYILKNPTKEVSESDFLADLSGQYNKDKAAFVSTISNCFNEIFDVIDTNKDRSIEADEFVIAFQAFGHENEPVVRKAFELMGPKDGLIPLRDIVNAWITFVTSDDASKPDPVKQAFETGF
ncbi:sarcoplasmic calcium-binding protein-like isoform X2 [Mytilus edulis]|uniref:Sarcoplasmic calcium-binding protein n=1 Tax=Mytilus edulis TaxID=6550 RepID=A0A8S3TGM1_MYTED|nr:Sarcoplasmic calcium-binding protein [Mytilus edulis]